VKTDTERPSLASPEPAEEPEERRRNPVLRFLGELPGLVLMALILAVLIKTFLVQAFFIPSPSMVPTLQKGDRVLVTKIPYYVGEPKRGDVIVFEEPDPQRRADDDRGLVGGAVHWLTQTLGVAKPDQEDYIKRVIGLPGDEVEGKRGKVYVNGVAIEEPYLVQDTGDFDAVKVPEGMLFVMGDNRSNSLDSRYGLGVNPTKQQGVGFIPIEKVVGKAFFIAWPPSRMSGF
jgi:signal peptidase I